MRKLFSFIVVALFAVSAMATTVTFDFTSAENWQKWGIAIPEPSKETKLNGVSITEGGVKIEFIAGTGSTQVRLWNSSGNLTLRTYAQNGKEPDKITISVEGTDKINEIALGVSMSLDGGENAATHTFADGVTSATFSGQATIKSIDVKINEDVVVWTPDTLTVSEARKLIAANDPLCKKTHYIKGIASSDNFGKNWPGWAMIWMRDEVNVTDSLEGYQIYNTAERLKFASAEEVGIMVGDTVLLFADGLAKYNTIFETTSGYLVDVKHSSAIAELEITDGSASYNSDEQYLILTLTTEEGVFGIVFSHEKSQSIVGEYSDLKYLVGVTLDGEELKATKFSMGITYDNDSYQIVIIITTEEQTYILNGEGLILGDFPDDKPFVPGPLPEGVKTCEEIYAIGMALGDNATTEEVYTVRGWVITPFAAGADKNTGAPQQSAYLADERTAKSGSIQAYYCYIDEEVVKGDYVEVVGTVTKYVQGEKLVIEMKNGQMTKLNKAEGFFNATESVKAVKRVINGQLYIERAGVLYTVTGTAL